MIALSNVTKRLGGQMVLDGLSLEIERGETMVIIGRSGSGKSVALKHMVGLMRADSGTVTVDGVAVGGLHAAAMFELRRKFGMLFQSGALINWLNVFDNVALPLREHTRMKPDAIRQEVMQRLGLLELDDHAEKMPADLSGGMRKRAGLARAIILDPQIILYDEPTSGLDPVMGSRINQLIVDVKNELKVTSVVVTHDMDSAYRVGDRIAMLYGGRIVQVGSPDEIRNSDNGIVRQFVEGRIGGPMD